MKESMNYSSIRFKLIAGGILIMLIPMVLIGYFSITNSANAVIKLSKTNQQYIAKGTAMQVSATLEGELKVATAFATRTQVKSAAEAINAKGIKAANGDVGVIRRDIQRRFERLKTDYAAIFITDAAGALYAEAAEAGEELDKWDIAQQPLFQEAKASRKTVSGDIVRSVITGEPIIIICAPVISDSGNFLGVFGAFLKASVITDLVTANKIGDTGYCYMINSSGIMIAHPNKAHVLQLDIKTVKGMEKISQAMMAGRAGAESYVFKGVDKVAGFFPIKQNGWSVAATQNADEFLTSVTSLRNIIALIIVLSIVLTSMIIFLATTAITRPLNKVIDGLKDISRGKDYLALTKRIAITTADEIGILSGEFNSLMESISNLSVFKKVIEEDGSLDEVYQRLGKVFTTQIGLKHCSIFQVTPANTMSLIYPDNSSGEEMLWCGRQDLDNADVCKAKRTGHSITSISFPEICGQFASNDGLDHCCLPIVVSGATVAVVQFVFDTARTLPDSKDIEDKIFKAEQYINESLAVIETKRLMGSLRDAALIDSLTGLHNRRYLQEYTEKIVAGVRRRNKSIGLIMCDLDYFKQVNDTYGHHTGDIVLKETARIIQQSVREADIVIRFGGEEFLAVLLDISDGESMKIAEKIRSNIEQYKIKLPDGIIRKTISLGVSEFPADTETLWSCIKFADVALYRAKDAGRNRCVRFTKEMWKEEQV
jgi:diguanylate cyclase (GGDEF)-like protein